MDLECCWVGHVRFDKYAYLLVQEVYSGLYTLSVVEMLCFGVGYAAELVSTFVDNELVFPGGTSFAVWRTVRFVAPAARPLGLIARPSRISLIDQSNNPCIRL